MTSTAVIHTVSLSQSSRRAVCAVVFAIGAVLVATVGFAQSGTLHDAAHDTRHSLAFPCH